MHYSACALCYPSRSREWNGTCIDFSRDRNATTDMHSPWPRKIRVVLYCCLPNSLTSKSNRLQSELDDK